MRMQIGQWIVEHDGAGHITVFQENSDEAIQIDASNPLLDQSIVAFHRNFTGPSYVAFRVELMASGYRRYLLTSGEWQRIIAEASAVSESQSDSTLSDHWESKGVLKHVA